MPSKNSIEKLLQPKSVAIVGASPRTRMGRSVIQNAKKIGFTGAIWPVNPNYEEIEGLVCYKTLRALPEPPDCVIVLVPADGVLIVLEEAAAIGVKAAVIVANGFGDSHSSEGSLRNNRLLALATQHDMAIAGPNCLGYTSFVYRVASTYTDLPPEARAGGISIISQSGGLLNAAASYVSERSGGLNYLISGGNHAVVSLADYIEFLGDDPATRSTICRSAHDATGPVSVTAPSRTETTMRRASRSARRSRARSICNLIATGSIVVTPTVKRLTMPRTPTSRRTTFSASDRVDQLSMTPCRVTMPLETVV